MRETTPGAMRAAIRINDDAAIHAPSPTSTEVIARIIDDETVAPELLGKATELLDLLMVTRPIETTETSELRIRSGLRQLIAKARAG